MEISIRALAIERHLMGWRIIQLPSGTSESGFATDLGRTGLEHQLRQSGLLKRLEISSALLSYEMLQIPLLFNHQIVIVSFRVECIILEQVTTGKDVGYSVD